MVAVGEMLDQNIHHTLLASVAEAKMVDDIGFGSVVRIDRNLISRRMFCR